MKSSLPHALLLTADKGNTEYKILLPERSLIRIPKTVLNSLEAGLTREWLVTNGIGGYASSTVRGANTRRYHGLLVASFPRPLERQVVLAKVDEELTVGPKTYLLGTNEYQDGTTDPQGYRRLNSFRLELGVPTFEYRAGSLTLVKQIWMEHGRNTVYVLYRLREAPNEVALGIRPFCALRGYHQDGLCERQKGYSAAAGRPRDRRVRGCAVLAQDGGSPTRMVRFAGGLVSQLLVSRRTRTGLRAPGGSLRARRVYRKAVARGIRRLHRNLRAR